MLYRSHLRWRNFVICSRYNVEEHCLSYICFINLISLKLLVVFVFMIPVILDMHEILRYEDIYRPNFKLYSMYDIVTFYSDLTFTRLQKVSSRWHFSYSYFAFKCWIDINFLKLQNFQSWSDGNAIKLWQDIVCRMCFISYICHKK